MCLVFKTVFLVIPIHSIPYHSSSRVHLVSLVPLDKKVEEETKERTVDLDPVDLLDYQESLAMLERKEYLEMLDHL